MEMNIKMHFSKWVKIKTVYSENKLLYSIFKVQCHYQAAEPSRKNVNPFMRNRDSVNEVDLVRQLFILKIVAMCTHKLVSRKKT
jgi:hypothetical protein